MLTIQESGPILRPNKYVLVDDGTPVKEFETLEQAEMGFTDYLYESLEHWLDGEPVHYSELIERLEAMGADHALAVHMYRKAIS